MSELALRHVTTETTELSLEALAATINREHALVTGAVEDALTHAILAGEALLKAREAVPFGAWGAWLDSHFSAHRVTAANYVRLALFKDEIRTAGARNQTQALALVSGRTPQLQHPPANSPYRPLVKKLTAEGYSQNAIARHLGINPGYVWALLNPEKARQAHTKRTRLRAQRKAAVRKALEREQRDKLAKSKGGSLGKAWSQVHLLAQTIERAANDDDDLSARAALQNALQFVYKVEYELAEALSKSKIKS